MVYLLKISKEVKNILWQWCAVTYDRLVVYNKNNALLEEQRIFFHLAMLRSRFNVFR